MKKTVQIIGIVLLPFIGQSQNYQPLHFDSTIYVVDYPLGQLGGCVGNVASYQYEFTGDTVINSSLYREVYKNGFIYMATCYTGTPLGYQGAIRQDTILKKVFLIKPGSSVEELVYDFNLVVGDTIHSILVDSMTGCIDLVIDHVDSIFINGAWHKQWAIYSGLSCLGVGGLYIEGIGSLFGLLDYYYESEGGPELICINNNGTIIYPNGGTACSLPNSFAELNQSSCKMSIYNRPDEWEFHLNNTSSDYCQKVFFKIYDIVGREVYSGNFTNYSALKKINLPSGILLVKFYNEYKTVQIMKISNL